MSEYHDNPLTKKEKAVLAKVIPEFQKRFAEEDGAKVEMFEYNDDYVDFQITYADGNEESMAVERIALTSGYSISEIIDAIQ